jgi:hypothetical protein
MKRLIVLAACLALFGAACKKNAEPAPAAQPEQPAAAAPAGGPSANAPAPAAEPKKVEITEALVQKYIEYQKENLALVQQYVAESKKNIESAKGDAAKTLNQISINEKLSKEMEAKLDVKRQQLGMSVDELATLKDAAGAVAAGRGLYNQMGGDAAVAKMEADSKAQIAKMPAEQRAAAEAQFATMSKSLTDVRDGLDIRQKYGDKSADALLKYADVLAKQQWDALKELSGKK